MDKLFDVVLREGSSLLDVQRIVLVDRETGVNYLYLQIGYGGGLTPLRDADGKPVVTGQVPDRGEGFEKG